MNGHSKEGNDGKKGDCQKEASFGEACGQEIGFKKAGFQEENCSQKSTCQEVGGEEKNGAEGWSEVSWELGWKSWAKEQEKSGGNTEGFAQAAMGETRAVDRMVKGGRVSVVASKSVQDLRSEIEDTGEAELKGGMVLSRITGTGDVKPRGIVRGQLRRGERYIFSQGPRGIADQGSGGEGSGTFLRDKGRELGGNECSRIGFEHGSPNDGDTPEKSLRFVAGSVGGVGRFGNEQAVGSENERAFRGAFENVRGVR